MSSKNYRVSYSQPIKRTTFLFQSHDHDLIRNANERNIFKLSIYNNKNFMPSSFSSSEIITTAQIYNKKEYRHKSVHALMLNNDTICKNYSRSYSGRLLTRKIPSPENKLATIAFDTQEEKHKLSKDGRFI